MPGQRQLHRGQGSWDAVEQGFVEEVESPGDLLLHGRLFEADLPGQPEEVDLVAQRLGDRLALARGPSPLVEFDQMMVDAPVDLEHRDPLRLGRAEAGPVQQFLDRVGADPRRGGLGDRPVEAAGHGVSAGLAFDPPPAAGLGDVFGNSQQLQPDALSLQGFKLEGAIDVARSLAAVQSVQDFGPSRPHHVAQQAEKPVDDRLQVVFQVTVYRLIRYRLDGAPVARPGRPARVKRQRAQRRLWHCRCLH